MRGRDAALTSLEKLHGALVLLRSGAAGKGTEIAPPAGLRILLTRIEPVLAGRELANHDVDSCPVTASSPDLFRPSTPLPDLKTWVPGTIGERSDAVLQTVMARHGDYRVLSTELDSKALAARVAERKTGKSGAKINIQPNKNNNDQENDEHDLAFGRHPSPQN